VIAPLADVTTRLYLAHTHSGKTLPWTPEQTGLYTYLVGAVAMIVLSLISSERSKYWDLGKTVAEMNAAPKAGTA
jgi:hypothetical protein